MSFTQRLLSPVVEVRKGETSALLLMFLYSFLAMTSYNIVKPLTRAQFIQDVGADNLPVVLLFSGVLVGFIMTGYSRVASSLPPKSVIAMTQAAMAAMLLGFWVMFRGGLPNVSVAFYFVGQILGVLLISQFWTLANDVYARISDLAVVPYGQDKSARRDFRGSDARNPPRRVTPCG